MIRHLLLIPVVCITVWMVIVSVGLHRAPQVGSADELDDLRAQLRYLEPRMHDDLGARMQRLFPEGEVFADVLYGLAWCGLAERTSGADSLRPHALREARWALARMERPHVQAPFASPDGLPYGVFYHGWRDLLIGAIVRLDPGDTILRRRWDVESEALARAFAHSPAPFLPSYPGVAWPADNVVAMAGLSVHDRSHAGAYRDVIDRWVSQVRVRSGPYGSLPHAWDPQGDTLVQASRGCSQALICALLPAIDEGLAAEQYELFRARFLDERLGVPMVREHVKGTWGPVDVDSGPVLLGAGSSATVVGAAACRANGDVFHAQELDATCEGFGLAMGTRAKRYLLGALPVTDLFIAWSRSFPEEAEVRTRPGFLRAHAWSVLMLSLLWAPWWWPARRVRIGRGR
jgi:hypothetical protein